MKAIESYASDGDSKEIVAFLRGIISGDPSSRVRHMALETLSELDDAGLAAVRELARSSSDPKVREMALEILSER